MSSGHHIVIRGVGAIIKLSFINTIRNWIRKRIKTVLEVSSAIFLSIFSIALSAIDLTVLILMCVSVPSVPHVDHDHVFRPSLHVTEAALQAEEV